MASQPDREDRRQGADFVVDNSGDEAHLRDEVDRVWAALLELRARPAGATERSSGD